jgi:hypothetical protein
VRAYAKLSNEVIYGKIDTFSTIESLPPPTDGLIAYWPFNNNTNDESGNGHNGIISGGVLITKDRFGNSNSAYQFNGANGYINIGNTVKPNFPITVSIWVNSLSSGGFVFRNDDINSSAYYRGIGVGIGGDGTVQGFIGNGYASGSTRRQLVTNDSVIGLSKWQLVCIVFKNNNDIAIYINGIKKSGTWYGTATGMSYSSANGILGHHESYYFEGILDDIRVYNRALSSDEIQSLFTENGWNGSMKSKVELQHPPCKD